MNNTCAAYVSVIFTWYSKYVQWDGLMWGTLIVTGNCIHNGKGGTHGTRRSIGTRSHLRHQTSLSGRNKQRYTVLRGVFDKWKMVWCVIIGSTGVLCRGSVCSATEWSTGITAILHKWRLSQAGINIIIVIIPLTFFLVLHFLVLCFAITITTTIIIIIIIIVVEKQIKIIAYLKWIVRKDIPIHSPTSIE